MRCALDHASEAGCETIAFNGPALPAEIYDPTRNWRSDAAIALVEAIGRADGLLIATPSYHGGISGLIKNALDYAEDLSGNERPYLQGRAVGCIVCAHGAQAMGTTLSSLRAMVHALRGWPTPYGAAVLARPAVFGSPGEQADPQAVASVRLVSEQVIEFARMKALAALHEADLR